MNFSFLFTFILIIGYVYSWTALSTTGPVPPNRGAGKMVEIDNILVLFGGLTDCFDATVCSNVFYNDIYHFDTETNSWSRPVTYPDPEYGFPEPRAFFGATVDEGENAMVIYGGSSYPVEFIDFDQWNVEAKTYDDLWYYRPSTFTWQKIVFDTTAEYPGPRSGGELLMRANRLFLSGGTNANTFVSQEDTWSLNINSLVWTKLTGKFSNKIDNVLPFDLGRYIFPWVKQGGKAYAYSGNVISIPPYVGVQHQDMWSYDFVRNTWEDIVPFDENSCGTKNGFGGRVHGGMASVGNRLVNFFGDNNDDETECAVSSISSGQSPTNDTWVMKLHPKNKREWKRMDFPNDSPSLKRIYYTNSEEQSSIYVFGGFGVDCADPDATDVVWSNTMYKLDWVDVLSSN